MKLEELDPKNEAEIVAKSKEVFFIGVWSYSLMTLEVPGNAYCWMDHGMVKEVPNTGDALVDVHWQHVAEEFSVIFNKTILELRPELKSHECAHNKPTNSDSQKLRSFVATLSAAGYGQR